MDMELTPEKVEEMGRIFGGHLLSSLPPEEVLSRYEPKERVKGLRCSDAKRKPMIIRGARQVGVK